MINNSFWKNKRVLVTGHSGFKGSWLLLLLGKLGAETFGFSLEPEIHQSLFKEIYPKIKEKKIISDQYFGDINDLDNVSRYVKKANPDIVIHLAAQSLVREGYKNPLFTWRTNVLGSLNLLDALKKIEKKCSIVMVTTDKVYKNKEWVFGYRENDELGGDDPYSASKASAEIAVQSWRKSFCGNYDYQKNNLFISTARAGNVIGGGDWSKDRIVPDVINAIIKKDTLRLYNPFATRPWQHVLESLHGYLLLAEKMYLEPNIYCQEYNFGPNLESNQTVKYLANKIANVWGYPLKIIEESSNLRESKLLHLNFDKAYQELKWAPIWNIDKTITHTSEWYKKFNNGISAIECCDYDFEVFLDLILKN